VFATHRWPSYSTVLYLPREAEGAVIGDMAGTGVAQRLVQLFVGIRWARTYSACQAALRQAQSEAEGRDEAQETLQHVAASTVTTKQSELDAVRIKMAALPSDLPSDADISAASASWMALITQHAHAASDQREAERRREGPRSGAPPGNGSGSPVSPRRHWRVGYSTA